MADETPLSNLDSVFVDVANAVLSAQRELDRKAIYRRSLVYSIPRAAVSASFTMRKDSDQVFLVWGRGKTEESNNQTLGFTLVATPNLPTDPGSASMSSPPPVLTIPSFLVLNSDRDRLAADLLAALQSGSYAADTPSPKPPKASDIQRECKLIRQVLANDQKPKPDDSIGLIALPLADAPDATLMVRLGGPPDGVYLLERQPAPKVTLYSFDKTRADGLYYAPLRRVFATLRKWLLESQAGVALPAGAAPISLGFVPVGDFAEQLWHSQNLARRTLFDNARAEIGSATPDFQPFYELTDVGARLSYTLAANDASDPSLAFIQSLVEIRIPRPNAATGASPGIRLVSPEYIVTGDARQALLKMVSDHAETIANAFPEVQRDAYVNRLRDASSRHGAVAVLSYRDLDPQNHFLIVWPALVQGEQRDFAFRIQLRNGAIDKVEAFLCVNDCQKEAEPHIEQPLIPSIALVLSFDEYVGFHDFFHAIRIWNLRSAKGANARPQTAKELAKPWRGA